MNQLILGDNLEILKKLDSESVDLIYLDPPFFSNRNYEVIWGDEGEVRSFKDRWSGGVDHYIAWLKERVAEMHRILKPTGSIFLHCDWHANAYIRVDILDKIFGYGNFRGELIWQRTGSHNDAKNKLAVLTDTIWYYSRSEKICYNPIYGAHSEDYKEAFYRFDDGDGRGPYRLDNMASPNPRPNMMYEWKGFSFPAKGWRYEKTTMQKLDDEGRIYFPRKSDGSFDFVKRLCLKRFLKEQKGNLLGNVWTDIQNVQAVAKERIGYPTQKPELLMKRIIEMASNEKDVVMDPFVGGGTTVAVADKLNRQWIGIDQSVQAIKVTEMRLNNQMDLYSQPFTVQLHKYDYDTLRNKEAFAFEHFMVTQFGGTVNTKQKGDMGLDGKAHDGAPIQVKRSDGIGRNVVDNFLAALQRHDKKLYDSKTTKGEVVGYIIAFSFGKGAIEEVARLKNKENTWIKLVTVEEIIPISKKPSLTVVVADKGKDAKGLTEIEFTAEGKSAAGIEFYSWDFEASPSPSEGGGPYTFKASVLLDKTGIVSHKFKPGQHTIACKVVDNDGLENLEMIKLKVNGVVERG